MAKADIIRLLRRYEELDQDPNADMPQKMLTFYELDLGLNHITRKFAEPVPIVFSFAILDAEPIFTHAFFVDPSLQSSSICFPCWFKFGFSQAFSL